MDVNPTKGIKMTTEEKIAKLLVLQEVTTKNIDSIALELKDIGNRMPVLTRFDEQLKSVDKRISRLESMVSWIGKIVAGVLVSALLALVINKG